MAGYVDTTGGVLRLQGRGQLVVLRTYSGYSIWYNVRFMETHGPVGSQHASECARALSPCTPPSRHGLIERLALQHKHGLCQERQCSKQSSVRTCLCGNCFWRMTPKLNMYLTLGFIADVSRVVDCIIHVQLEYSEDLYPRRFAVRKDWPQRCCWAV